MFFFFFNLEPSPLIIRLILTSEVTSLAHKINMPSTAVNLSDLLKDEIFLIL